MPVQSFLLLFFCFHAAVASDPPPPRSRVEVDRLLKIADSAKQIQGSSRKLRLLLVAGPKDHGPGEHDYPKWQKEWAPLLAKAENVEVKTAFPWPTSDQWAGVDVAVFYFKSKWDAGQLAELKKHQDRGGGVATIHWAIGCDQEWDNHARHFGLSYKAASYRHGPVDLQITALQHPILLGFPKSASFVDEPYWPFIGDAKKVTVLAVSHEKIHQGDDRRNNPGDATVEAVPVFWTHELPESHARVFVSIFGHYAWTFDDPYFRLMMLRGIAWAARDNPYRLDQLAVDGVKLAP